jgi:8-oxo-dGTP pyrophosphatase MutT (NUDIX family)
LHWRDPTGRERLWESAERTTRRGAIDGVEILTIIRSASQPPQCLLVRQFRPPVGGETIEFPAGLIDAGETPEQAALRELQEETGYLGTVRSVSPISYTDPGLTNANMVTAIVDVDGDLPANQSPQPSPDDGEFITVYKVPLAQLHSTLQELAAAGCGIDSRVWNFAEGLALHSLLSLPSETTRMALL